MQEFFSQECQPGASGVAIMRHALKNLRRSVLRRTAQRASLARRAEKRSGSSLRTGDTGHARPVECGPGQSSGRVLYRCGQAAAKQRITFAQLQDQTIECRVRTDSNGRSSHLPVRCRSKNHCSVTPRHTEALYGSCAHRRNELDRFTIAANEEMRRDAQPCNLGKERMATDIQSVAEQICDIVAAKFAGRQTDGMHDEKRYHRIRRTKVEVRREDTAAPAASPSRENPHRRRPIQSSTPSRSMR